MRRRRVAGAIASAVLTTIATVVGPGGVTAGADLAVGYIDTYAGGPGWGPATGVAQTPVGVATDAANVYTVDVWQSVVRALDKSTGEQRIVAGTGIGFQPGAADGTPAVDLNFSMPTAVAVGPGGDLYVAEGGWDAWWFDETKVWRIDHVTGAAHTYVGGGDGTCEPDKAACPIGTVRLMLPRALAFDGQGNLFIADSQRHRVLRVDATTSTVRTVAGAWGTLGTGQCYQTCGLPGLGDGGPATLATLRNPNAVAVDAAGRTLLIADLGHDRVRQVDLLTGIITTVAGNGQNAFYVEGAPAPSVSLGSVTGVAFNPAGGFDITDGRAVRHVDATTKLIRTVSATAGAGLEALAFDVDGSIVAADLSGRQVVRVVGNGTATRIAGNGRCCWGGPTGPARGAVLFNAEDLALGPGGDIFLAESGTVGPNDAGFVRRVDASQQISMFAGTGQRGSTGDGGPATRALLDMPTSVAAAGDGAVYIADAASLRIRRVSSAGVITTVAGTGEPAWDDREGVLATEARVGAKALTVDAAGRLVFAEDNRIRRIDTDGRIRTIAGPAGAFTRGFAGDGGTAGDARFCGIEGLAYDSAGNLLVADRGNHRIRRITPSGAVSTVAGSGAECTFLWSTSSGDGGPATAATFVDVADVAVDDDGVVYIGDRNNVRRVGTDGIISTVAGNGMDGTNGTYSVSGDGGLATQAAMGNVMSLAVDDSTGRLYILHHGSFTNGSGNRVRVVQLGLG